MASDQAGLSKLLQWSIANSDNTQQAEANASTSAPTPASHAPTLDPKILAALLGGPSDADLMREAIAVVTAEESTLENKLIAWDNLEQLVESIDNANNLEPLKLWTPLLGQLAHKESECRMYAAWVISTAVQNNIKCQEKLLSLGGVDTLLQVVLKDDTQKVRKKAATAISSEIRNFQPALDDLLEKIPNDVLTGSRRLDATDMEQVDIVVDALRRKAVSG